METKLAKYKHVEPISDAPIITTIPIEYDSVDMRTMCRVWTYQLVVLPVSMY